ncbi:7-cyano-7-deazaguanine synthase [Bradyrhizobium sp. USDA 4524]|uniref:7-cyano-7-deazaguanine synthase n=1 Tax=unclassified Bradyrhizobium TaxID=2631580 RepID=UPI00209F21FC|nr:MULTISPECIES: 7-cyano-7-deazaguanine synthase [unclassified Bradyrhizobium]MCP1842135.1 7-cyano-7-deazaguanine synthase [Bradyrhizobium sp. USDA 4538]MCP1902699.1 7-cyano-7-deazaguanine synthase [Bradyrhizobium sp. USDA 4537]MCP1991644.1 7-cyano-7-deazaguanine synthase [Bradyrhizobium sp. USDA 4539]
MRVLLFSGGLDSSALAFWKRPDACLTVDYGQRPARGEMAAAAAICRELGLRHEVLAIDLRALGAGSLAGAAPSALGAAEEFWPYRNQMLITMAGMRFLPQGLKEIMIGAVRTDVHADGKSPFLRGIDRLMSLQEGAVSVTAPARALHPRRLLEVSGFPRSLVGLTFSCHVMEYACGQCRGCEKHLETVARFATSAALERRI